MKLGTANLFITPRGLLFLLMTAPNGGAAIARGNNMLFILFSTLLGLFAATLLLTWVTARGITVTRLLPSRIFAGEIGMVTLRFHQRGRFWPAIALMFQDHLTHDQQPLRQQPPPVMLPFAPPGARVRTHYDIALPQRGWVRFESILLTSSFPPGLSGWYLQSFLYAPSITSVSAPGSLWSIL